MTMRLEVVPPLSPATAWIEVLAAGQSVQARATLPASLAVAAGGYQPAWPPRRSHRADCYLTAARSFGESYACYEIPAAYPCVFRRTQGSN